MKTPTNQPSQASQKLVVKTNTVKKTVAVAVKKPVAKKTVAVKKPVDVKKPTPPVAENPIKFSSLKERIMDLMKDGVSRTVTEIHQIWGIEYSSTIGRNLNELAADGKLERLVGTTSAAIYRLARETPTVAPDAITNNPFLWRTYKQWVPENNNHVNTQYN